MTDERWPRVKALFQSAADRPPGERHAFLADATGDDEALRREVASLLTWDAADASVLDSSPVAGRQILADGLRVGPYEIVAPLGAGAMGDVYRAFDTKLHRDVALKVLPDSFAGDPDRLARFGREAQTLAALNHPNIAHIHGLEESGDVRALVMELVEGEDLSQRIARGPMRIDEVLPIAKQIVEALEAAHERGIIHRDLKPANIRVRVDGTVKVLDFGLAKAVDPLSSSATRAALANSPAITSPAALGAGVILGTAAYMSPEQARGKPLDRRTDIWSFGCVLYEMLTGRTPFAGDTISDTLAAILDREPVWDALPHTTPVPIRRLLRRCLEKDRKRRLDSAGDARLEFDDTLATPAADILAPPANTARRFTPMVVAIVAGIAIAATSGAWVLTRPAVVAPMLPSRFAIIPPVAPPTNVSGPARDLALSPDGRHLVYRVGGTDTAGSALMVRAIDRLDAQPVANVTRAYAPFISPDSQWIGFFENSELKKVSIAGGPIIVLCHVAGTPLGATWGDDNVITFATNSPGTGLRRVPAHGGEPTSLTTPDAAQHEATHAFPSALPRGRGVLFTITTAGQVDRPEVAVLDLKTGQRKTLIRGGGDAQYVETGHLLFAAAGTLRAVKFDQVSLEILAEPVAVERVMLKPSGAANYAVARSGTLVYMPDAGGPLRTLVWVDRKGHEELINAPLRTYGPPRLSPDGTRVATGILEKGDTDIWIWDLARETLKRLTLSPGMDGLPLWTPNGQRIVFMSDRTGVLNLYSQAADGSGTVDRLTTSAIAQWPTSMTPDGRWLVGFGRLPKTGPNIAFFPMPDSLRRTASDPIRDVSQLPVDQLAGIRFEGAFAEFSPNGRYVAHQSDESGKSEIYVRPFPNVELERWQVSTAGGSRPAWARDGTELFYLDGSNTLTSVPVRTSEATFTYGSPAKVFDAKYVEPNPARHYDVSRDGSRFLMIKDSADRDPSATRTGMVVVEHWFEELKQRAR